MGENGGDEDERSHAKGNIGAFPDGGEDQICSARMISVCQVVDEENQHGAKGKKEKEVGVALTKTGYPYNSKVEGCTDQADDDTGQHRQESPLKSGQGSFTTDLETICNLVYGTHNDTLFYRAFTNRWMPFISEIF